MGNNIAPAIEELRRAFTELKPVFDQTFGQSSVYDDKQHKWVQVVPSVNMPMPIITIQARGRKKVDGWYKPAAWDNPAAVALNTIGNMGSAQGQKKVIASTDEITIAAEVLDEPSDKILTVLTHQMLHHYAKHNRQGVLQNENGYHTQRFRNLANNIGLEAEPDGSHGYAATKVAQWSDQLPKSFAAIALDRNAFDMHRIGEKEREFKGSKLKKWSCGCTNIRVATILHAECKSCGNPFKYADKDRDNEDVQRWLNYNNEGSIS